MSSTVSKYLVLEDDGGQQASVGYLRESDAWTRFWARVSRQPDDGEALTGFDEKRVLASRTGLNSDGRRWYVHLMRETA